MSMATVAAAGAGLSAYGAYAKAQSQQDTLNYEAAIARNNQTITNYQADIEQQNAAINEQNVRLKTASMMGDQRAALAANGVDVGQGSAAEILASSKFMGERDALMIRDEGARRAWALQEQAKGYGSEAGADSAMAGAINPLMAGASSLLTGASSVGKQWYQQKKATE